MSAPQRRIPHVVLVEPDKTYFWCRCGLSANQPFCDGSHRETELTPEKFVASRRKYIYFCGCKRTANAPFCDGSHKTLPLVDNNEE